MYSVRDTKSSDSHLNAFVTAVLEIDGCTQFIADRQLEVPKSTAVRNL
jgi:hypothetical protein